MAGIDALPGRTATVAPDDARATQEEASDSDMHVLLSNYQQQGPAN